MSGLFSAVLKVCSLFCGLKNVLLKMSATKHAVLLTWQKCALKNECSLFCGLKCVCSLFCGLDFVCALSFLRSSNKKNVVLTQRYPKTCGLKKVPISQPQQPLQTPSSAQHIFIGLATFHYSLTPSPLIVVAPHSLKLTPNFAIFQKFPLFRVVHAQIHFFSPGPKNTRFFNAPELDVY